MRCKKCNYENPDGNKYCGGCGAELFSVEENNRSNREYSYTGEITNKMPIWKKTWLLVLMCIFIPPVGLILLWVSKKPRNIIGRIAITIFLLFYSLVWLLGFSGEEEVNEDNTTVIESNGEISDGEEENLETEEEYKSSCKEYAYKTVLREPEKYVGERIKITVKISSVHEASWMNDTKYYFANSNDENDWWLGDRYGVFDKREEQKPKLLEDDIITVYGEIADTEQTTSLIVSSSEIFCIDMKYIDFISE